MRGTGALLPAKHNLKQLYPFGRSWGWVATSTPKKQESDQSMERRIIANETAGPIAAFSRPPPLPPVLGPILAASLMEMLWRGDGEDD